MNVDYDDDTRALMEHARRLLDARGATLAARRVLEDDALFHDADLWREVGDQGWCGIVVAERDGGLGLGMVALCGLAEELGRTLAPVPFASSIYGFAHALTLHGTDQQRARWLPGVTTGATIGALAFTEGPGQPFTGSPRTNFRDGRLNGIMLPVSDGMIADVAVVLAHDENGASLLLVDLSAAGVAREPVETIDPIRPAARIVFDNVSAERLGAPQVGRALAIAVMERQATTLAFEQIGGADRCLTDATAFARDRHAFGRPIGGFQAIKHKLAEMFVANQMARSIAYFASWAADHDAAAFPAAAAAARIAASEAYWRAAREAIQIHGGLGFTWEMDCHLHFRRARHLAVAAGGPAWWRQRLADILRAQVA